MPKLTLLIGLSASGKSTYLEPFMHDGVPVFDDFMKGSPPEFVNCKHLEKIRQHLAAGRDVVISDIRLIRASFREEVLSGLSGYEFEIEHVCFSNDPQTCLQNSARRVTQQARDHECEIELITKYSREYTIPESATVIEVVRSKYT
ncbi:ATP-binding protein [Brevifollis gellanilyticus]|uniref:ATP-binding protein n=1 Tax=Brevifollis gellanilyticus TaxID=748831 RepID=A0A512MH47_9BACT|nr:ATP-binding protein [Brevifollis gellanilyticus]GEP46067.1 hypothetical protein BGE01nite_53580 [Brevifollis gellanilyticus]